jgi:putative integral membrane protein (TIGR02587 family)
VAGGLLFSLPLFYTAEVWWAGVSLEPFRIGIAVAATYLLLLGYNRFVGIRQDASWSEVLIDSIEELGLGIVVAALMLWLVGRIESEQRPAVIVAQVTLAGLLAAIGVSVGTAQLGDNSDDAGVAVEDKEPLTLGERLVKSCCGAVLLSTNIAPTDEVSAIAIEIGPARLLGLVVLSLLVAAGILSYSYQKGNAPPGSGPRRLISDIATTYCCSLLCARALLWFFGLLDGQSPAGMLTRIIVLGVAATFGAAAGRLLLRGNSVEELA